MTIDQLIAELQRLKEEGVSGDTEVVYHDSYFEEQEIKSFEVYEDNYDETKVLLCN